MGPSLALDPLDGGATVLVGWGGPAPHMSRASSVGPCVHMLLAASVCETQPMLPGPNQRVSVKQSTGCINRSVNTPECQGRVFLERRATASYFATHIGFCRASSVLRLRRLRYTTKSGPVRCTPMASSLL